MAPKQCRVTVSPKLLDTVALEVFPLSSCLGIPCNLIPPGPPWFSGEGVDNGTPPWIQEAESVWVPAQSKRPLNSHHDNNYSWTFSWAHSLHPCGDGLWRKGLSQLKKGCPLSPLPATSRPIKNCGLKTACKFVNLTLLFCR